MTTQHGRGRLHTTGDVGGHGCDGEVADGVVYGYWGYNAGRTDHLGNHHTVHPARSPWLTRFLQFYALVWLFAPSPRPPTKSEKQYITMTAEGQISPPQPLPCWYDNHMAVKEMARNGLIAREEAFQISDAEVFMTLVIPAYNEMHRLNGMLEEAVGYLEEQYGHHGTPSKSSSDGKLQASGQQGDPRRGWEIILVSDGSTDKTVNVALNFARTHQLATPPTYKGPWSGTGTPTNIRPGTIRVVSLEENRGKGGAVTHGMRHARGTYVVFADADGASRFTDLGKLVSACEKAKDKNGRAVGVGSRAHMVGTEAVVKVRLFFFFSFPSTATYRTGLHTDSVCTAIGTSQPPHARIPSWYLAPHHTQSGAN